MQRVYQVAWSADSRLLCSSSADSTLKLSTDSPAGRMATPNSREEELMEEDEMTTEQENKLLGDQTADPSISPASGTQV